MNKKVKNNDRNPSIKKNSRLSEELLSDPEKEVRLGIKAVDEFVKNEAKKRRVNAPLTVEEKVLFNY